MKLFRGLVTAALVVGLVALFGHGADKDRENLMRRKLAASQKVLEGLATNDFKAISSNAEELIAISKEAEWKALKTPQYEVHSNDFRRTAETLAKYADDKNLDGAALTYLELTLICVKCHKHVREVKWTKAD